MGLVVSSPGRQRERLMRLPVVVCDFPSLHRIQAVNVLPHFRRRSVFFALLLAALAGSAVQAQTIDRVRMTDNDLSCQQIYTETVQMDGVVARASQPAQPVAVVDPNNNAATQVAGAVAQVAVVQSAARGGFGGFGNIGGASLFGGLLGGVAQQAANNNAQQQMANQQVAAQQTQQNALLGQQAQGRKEHLTTLFLSKGCKLADVQR
jgi:hypothetical protein